MRVLLLLVLFLFASQAQAQTYSFKNILDSSNGISALSDVTTTGVATNDILAWDGSNWVVSQTTVATGTTIDSLDDITDVNSASPNTGDILVWDGDSWETQTVTETISTTTMLAGWPDAIKCDTNGGERTFYLNNAPYTDGDVYYTELISSGTDRYINYNSDGTYGGKATYTSIGDCQDTIANVYAAGRGFNFIGNNGASTTLTEIGDVNTSGVATNDILAYNGTTWVVSQTTVATGTTIDSLDDITDVNSASPNTGDILVWDGDSWETQTVTETISTTTMLAGWPDAIACTSGTQTRILVYLNGDSTSTVTYRMTNPNNLYDIYFTHSTGAYSSHANMTGFDCVTSSKSIATLYSDGQAFNFIGNNGGSTTLNEIGDVTATDADGNFLVGTGSGFVMESGATARTSLGLGTTDDVAFDDIAATGTVQPGTTGTCAASGDVGKIVIVSGAPQICMQD